MSLESNSSGNSESDLFQLSDLLLENLKSNSSELSCPNHESTFIDEVCDVSNVGDEYVNITKPKKTFSMETLYTIPGILTSVDSHSASSDDDTPSDKPLTYHSGIKNNFALRLLKEAKLIDNVKFHKPTFQVAEDIVIEILHSAKMLLSKYNIKIHSEKKPYPNVIWPTQAEFNIFIGLDKIDKYISTWKLHSDWKYYIDLKQINEYPFTKEYVYEVKFSCPRKQFPVAQATASVYFFIGVSYCSPLNSFVDVMFMVESTGSKFYPGNVHFNQKWLELVVDSKVHFFKQIRI